MMSAAAPFSSGTVVRSRVAQMERTRTPESRETGARFASNDRAGPSNSSSTAAYHADHSPSNRGDHALQDPSPSASPRVRQLEDLSPHSVLSTQIAATNAWRRDLKSLHDQASARFADVCWTTDPTLAGHGAGGGSDDAGTDDEDFEEEEGVKVGRISRAATPQSILTGFGNTSIALPSSYNGKSLIFAHKALIYARAPNTFQTKYLHLRTPAVQLGQAAAEESTVSLPLIASAAQPLPSIELSRAPSIVASPAREAPTGLGNGEYSLKRSTSPSSLSSVRTGKDANASGTSLATPAARAKKATVRGAFPPSSYSTKRMSSGGTPGHSRSGSGSGVDSDGESAVSSVASNGMRISGPRIPARRTSAYSDGRRSASRGSFISAQGEESGLSDAEGSLRVKTPASRPKLDVDQASIGASSLASSLISDASSMRTIGTLNGRTPYLGNSSGYRPQPSRPIYLEDTSQGFLEAILEYLYTAEESMVKTFEFLYEDSNMIDSASSKQEKLEKLQQDLTYMWRSKLFSDLKIVLDDNAASVGGQSIRNIPDTMSVLSLPMDMTEDPEDEVTSFSCHRFMLASRSPYFAAQLLTPFADQKAAVIHLPSPPFTPAAVHFTLGFIYSGTLSFSNRSFDLSTAFQLWRAGAYLGIETLQAVVSSIIASEFCHGFTCSTAPASMPGFEQTGSPCKSCAKRVGRTLAFASCSDVNDSHLLESARKAVSGPFFGVYWNKDVGNLDYASRGAIVAAICERLDQSPEGCIGSVRQLALAGAKVEMQRGAAWVDALRWMIESVEAKVRETLESQLDRIVESEAWLGLIHSVGFSSDVLEKLLVLLIDALTEKRAAPIYQILVGQVLLREEGAPTGQERQMVDDARSGIIRYLKRRWVSVRAAGGFEGLENWALKEIADELDLKVDDLLQSNDAAIETLSRTGLKITTPAASTGGKPARASPLSPASAPIGKDSSSTNGSARRPAVRDTEREPGPINLRAAAVNRNAARSASVATPVHRPPARSSTGSSRPPPAAASTSTRPAAVAVRQPSLSGLSTTRTASARSTAATPSAAPARRTSNASIRTTASTASAAPSIASNAATSSAVRSRTTSTMSAKSSASSLRGTQNQDRRPAVTSKTAPIRPAASHLQTPSKAASPSLAPGSPTPKPATRTRAVPSTSQGSSSPAGKRTPTQSLRSVRSTTSVRSSTSAPSKENAPPVPSLQAEAFHGDDTIKRSPLLKAHDAENGEATQRVRQATSPRPPLSAATFTPPEASPAPSSDVETFPRSSRTALSKLLATRTCLAHGIPCIVAPNQAGAKKPPRFRALVRYIGPLQNQQGSWLGVEVSAPLPAILQGDGNLGIESIRTDGSLDGVRYFDLGSSHNSKQSLPDSAHASDSEIDEETRVKREQRRKRVSELLASSSSNIESLSDVEDRSTARRLRKDMPLARSRESSSRRSSRAGSDAGGDSVGLFIRPEDVLWVVMPE